MEDMAKKPKPTKAALEKKRRKARAALGDGLAGRAMDALAARRKRMDAMIDQ
jgi:hypothetical protein